MRKTGSTELNAADCIAHLTAKGSDKVWTIPGVLEEFPHLSNYYGNRNSAEACISGALSKVVKDGAWERLSKGTYKARKHLQIRANGAADDGPKLTFIDDPFKKGGALAMAATRQRPATETVEDEPEHVAAPVVPAPRSYHDTVLVWEELAPDLGAEIYDFLNARRQEFLQQPGRRADITSAFHIKLPDGFEVHFYAVYTGPTE